jgi:hypothetical protein
MLTNVKQLAWVGLLVMVVTLSLLIVASRKTQDIRPQATTSTNCSEDRADINCDGRIDLSDLNILLLEIDN